VGKPPIERHLAAFKAEIGFATGTGLLALVALPRCSAPTRTLTAPNDTLLLISTLGRVNIKTMHHFTSSTATKCATFLVMPSTASETSCTRDEPILRRPSDRTVAL
jgi:hypothetical protein